MKNNYQNFVWRPRELTRLDLDPEVATFILELQTCDGITIQGPNIVCSILQTTKCPRNRLYIAHNYNPLQIYKDDVDDIHRHRFTDADFYPPRIFLKANERHFTHCSVSVENVQGCTFELPQLSGDGVRVKRHNLG